MSRYLKVPDLRASSFHCPIYNQLIADLNTGVHPMHPLRDLLEQMIHALLDAEMDIFLRNHSNEGVTNKRNGRINKKVRAQVGILDIKTPRDRRGEFVPMLIPKWVKEVPPLLEPLLLCLYADTSSIAAFKPGLSVIYGSDISEESLDRLAEAAHQCALSISSAHLQPVYRKLFVLLYDIGSLPWKFHHCPDHLITVFGINPDGRPEVLSIKDEEKITSWSDYVHSLCERGLETVTSLQCNFPSVMADNLTEAFTHAGITETPSRM